MKRLALVIALAAGVAHAQNNDVAAQIKLVEQQPSDMDRSAWKEKRRDAARALGKSKDKRAVPVLIKLAEAETFDLVGEIAIEGLGNLGDQSAVPVLQKIAADNSRDKTQRELAKKALDKLGASAQATVETPPDRGTGLETGGGGGSADVKTGGGGGSGNGGDVGPTIGAHATEGAPQLPSFEDDTIAAYQRLTFAAGTASLGYDTIRKRLAFDADVGGAFAKRIEREKMAWGVDVGAHVVTGLVNPEGRGQSRGAQIDITGTGEARIYSGNIYGVGKAAVGAHFEYISDIDPNDASGASDLKDSRFLADLQVALGGGYGRVVDVGGAIRIRRIARTLEAARALGRPIDASTSKKLQLTWWALRGERSMYRSVVLTVEILREAGILLGEPDAGLTFELLNVLRDTQLSMRPQGLDIQLAFGEGYLQRPDEPMNALRGRVEMLLVQAGYGAQLQDDKLELSGTAYATMRLFADDMMGEDSPKAAGAIARMRRYTYGDHGDPFGAFDLLGELRVSSDGDPMMSEKGLRLGGELGFTYWLNQASGVRLAAQVAFDTGELFIGGVLQATYGLLEGSFAR